MNNINSEVYTDISVIINMMPIEMRSKISDSFINFIENNKSTTYISSINPKIPIKEQNIRKETQEMLGIIYRDYLCSAEEKELLFEKEKIELYEIEAEKAKKYNPDKLFTSKITEENRELQTNSLIKITNEKWYNKFLKFLKGLLRK